MSCRGFLPAAKALPRPLNGRSIVQMPNANLAKVDYFTPGIVLLKGIVDLR
jgi:hypothetical protein